MMTALTPRNLIPTFGFVFALAAPAAATEAKVENYSNDVVYVAQADAKGHVQSSGWTAAKPNETVVIKAADGADLHLRVQDKGGNEITFPGYKTFHNFVTHAEPFSVKQAPDDPAVWVLKHGEGLAQSHNMKGGDKLPAGWSDKRYFEVGKGTHKLEIKP